jgi:hypothetical protein
MTRKFKYITSVFLIIVFLLDTAVKIEHHHQHYAVDFKNERHNTVIQDNCPLCNFEFPVFLSSIEYFHLQNANLIDAYLNTYNSRYNSDFLHFSFLLRAPPFIQI